MEKTDMGLTYFDQFSSLSSKASLKGWQNGLA